MRNRLLLGFVAFMGIVGCAGKQAEPVAPGPSSKHSFPEAMKMLCDVDKLANLSPDDDLLEIGRKRSAWLSDEVDNGDFSEFRTLVSVKGPEDQVVKIRSKAKELGITACPLADSIEANPTGVLVP
jgi:hypothetical protein